MENYFITGITGFLGRNIVIELLKRKDVRIFGFALPNDKEIPYCEENGIKMVTGNILSRSDLRAFLSQKVEGKKYLIHAAGKISVYRKNDPFCQSINLNGTKAVVDACLENGFDRFLFVSSVDALSPREDGEIEEQNEFYPEEVEGVYAKAKASAGNYVLKAYREKGLPALIVCPSAIMGPNDPFNAPINVAIKKYLTHSLPALTKGGYDIVDVRDVAKGILDCIEFGQVGESYLLTGNRVSVVDLIGEAAKASGGKRVKLIAPSWAIKMASPFIEGYARLRKKTPLFTSFAIDLLFYNPNYHYEKASKAWGYSPKSMEETMRDTIAWMRESGYLNK